MNVRTRNIAIDGNDIEAIIFRNFSGKPDRFNPQGCQGNFTVILNNDIAKDLENQGLNVVYKENRDGDLEPRLKVFLRFDNYPPKVFQVTSKNQLKLDAETVDVLDSADIANADIVISPYSYEFAGRKGVKAYLSSGYFTIQEDAFAEKYRGMAESGDLPF